MLRLNRPRPTRRGAVVPMTAILMVVLLGMVAFGLFRIFVLGQHLQAETAHFGLKPDTNFTTGIALPFLLLRAFATGCAALIEVVLR